MDSPDWLIHAFLLNKRLQLLGKTSRQAKTIGALIDLATVASRMAYHLAEKPARDQPSQYSRIGEEVRDGMVDLEATLASALATFGAGEGSPVAADMDSRDKAPEEYTPDEMDYDDVSPTQIVDARSDGMSSPAPYPLGDFAAPAIAAPAIACAPGDNESPKKLSLDAESMNKLVASLLPSLEPSLVPAVAWFLHGPILQQISSQLPQLLLRNESCMATLVQEVASKLEASQASRPAGRETPSQHGAQTYGQAGGSGWAGESSTGRHE